MSILKDEKLNGKSLLSKFTILENNFCGMASNHLLKNDYKQNISNKSEKTEMKELIKTMTHNIREAMFELSKVIDTGGFHTLLKEDKQMHIELYPLIPKCFKIELKELTSPIQVTIGYEGDHVHSPPEISGDNNSKSQTDLGRMSFSRSPSKPR